MSTIIQQGRFTSDGNAKIIELRGGVDWMTVYNRTQWSLVQSPGHGIIYEWMRGLDPSEGLRLNKSGGGDVIAGQISDPAFTLLPKGASGLISGTTITKASPPVCTANAHGFSNGNTVTLHNLTNMPQISGGTATFTIGNVTTNTFELSFFDTNTANFVAETSFKVESLPFFTWRGSWAVISSITLGSTTQVQLTTNEPEQNYSIGTIFNFSIPSVFGTTELDGRQGSILSFDSVTNTYTIAIDSSTFTSFAWPNAAAVPFSPPTVQIEGTISNNSPDAVNNIEFIGMELASGRNGPAGSLGDIIFWKAGKSFSVDLE